MPHATIVGADPQHTEPVVRLNVESRGDHVLMEEKTQELLHLLEEMQ